MAFDLQPHLLRIDKLKADKENLIIMLTEAVYGAGSSTRQETYNFRCQLKRISAKTMTDLLKAILKEDQFNEANE